VYCVVFRGVNSLRSQTAGRDRRDFPLDQHYFNFRHSVQAFVVPWAKHAYTIERTYQQSELWGLKFLNIMPNYNSYSNNVFIFFYIYLIFISSPQPLFCFFNYRYLQLLSPYPFSCHNLYLSFHTHYPHHPYLHPTPAISPLILYLPFSLQFLNNATV
jgi:hypothetical protein